MSQQQRRNRKRNLDRRVQWYHQLGRNVEITAAMEEAHLAAEAAAGHKLGLTNQPTVTGEVVEDWEPQGDQKSALSTSRSNETPTGRSGGVEASSSPSLQVKAESAPKGKGKNTVVATGHSGATAGTPVTPVPKQSTSSAANKGGSTSKSAVTAVDNKAARAVVTKNGKKAGRGKTLVKETTTTASAAQATPATPATLVAPVSSSGSSTTRQAKTGNRVGTWQASERGLKYAERHATKPAADKASDEKAEDTKKEEQQAQQAAEITDMENKLRAEYKAEFEAKLAAQVKDDEAKRKTLEEQHQFNEGLLYTEKIELRNYNARLIKERDEAKLEAEKTQIDNDILTENFMGPNSQQSRDNEAKAAALEAMEDKWKQAADDLTVAQAELKNVDKVMRAAVKGKEGAVAEAKKLDQQCLSQVTTIEELQIQVKDLTDKQKTTQYKLDDLTDKHTSTEGQLGQLIAGLNTLFATSFSDADDLDDIVMRFDNLAQDQTRIREQIEELEVDNARLTDHVDTLSARRPETSTGTDPVAPDELEAVEQHSEIDAAGIAGASTYVDTGTDAAAASMYVDIGTDAAAASTYVDAGIDAAAASTYVDTGTDPVAPDELEVVEQLSEIDAAGIAGASTYVDTGTDPVAPDELEAVKQLSEIDAAGIAGASTYVDTGTDPVAPDELEAVEQLSEIDNPGMLANSGLAMSEIVTIVDSQHIPASSRPVRQQPHWFYRLFVALLWIFTTLYLLKIYKRVPGNLPQQYVQPTTAGFQHVSNLLQQQPVTTTLERWLGLDRTLYG